MPVWNRANIIRSAIESVLAQTFKDYELLITDDGSEDDLENTVRPFFSENVIYNRLPHQGVGSARNFGLQRARGTYIAYLDSDNTWHPDFLSKMYKVLSKSPHHDAAYCKCNRFKKDEKGHICLHSVLGEEFNFKKLVCGNYIDLNTFVHSKQCLNGQINFDENLKRLNDWDFILKITSKHIPVFVNDILVDYNFDFPQNTITFNEDYLEPLLRIKERFKQFDDRTAEVVHDGIRYKFEDVDEKKYYNYLKTSHQADWNTTDFTAHGFPYILQIEPTNFCNLSCTVCPAAANKRDLNRDRRHMSLSEFKSIIDDMQDYLLFVVLWDWGEPFLNPELPEMIRYASQKRIKTVTSTNAHFLNDTKYLERILTSGLTTLIIAIDSLKKDSYEFYRRGGNLAQAMAGLKNVLTLKKKLKSKTLVNLRMVLMKSNEDEIADMRRVARKLRVDKFTVKTAYPNRGATLNDEQIVPNNPEYRRYVYKPGTYERIRMNVPCTKPWFLINIHTNGNVVACNYDYDQEMRVGNVFEKPLSEIWNGPACRELRKKLYYDKDSILKCRECDINFKLSKVGWFIEVLDCNLSIKRRVFNAAKKFAKKVLPKKAINVLRKGYQISIKGAAGFKRILFPGTSRNPRLYSRIYSYQIPLPPDEKKGWKPYPLFYGSTKFMPMLGCHASVLTPHHIPHPPHSHKEEELLLLLSGELDLIVPDEKDPQGQKRTRIKPNQVLYYPVDFTHAIQTMSNDPANYLMLKWQSRSTNNHSPLPFGHFNLFDPAEDSKTENDFCPCLVFEGPTSYLQKLRCHISTLTPQAGYDPHIDNYDVIIVVLEGEVEILGQRAGPHSVIFYAAGEPHGIHNPSNTITAKYVVFEIHGNKRGVMALLPDSFYMALIKLTALQRWKRK